MNKFEDDIYLNTKGYYNVIKSGSILWYTIRTLQILLLFLSIAAPYFFAIIVAGCLGF